MCLKTEGKALLKKLKDWDNDMVQRKSKAYDDVENFENKFSANYLFLFDQTDNETYKVNRPSLELKSDMDAQWRVLKQRAETLIKEAIPEYNKALWESGVGALRM